MDVTTLVTFAAAFALAVALPGPGIAALVARALASGFRPGLAMIAGMVLGELVFLTFAASGLTVVATQLGTVFLLIKWGGAAYILYMAWSLLTAPATGPVLAAREAGTPVRGILVGLSITLGNPKVMMVYLALLPTLVDLERLSLSGFAELAAVVVAILSMVLTAYAILASRARRLLASPRALRAVNRGAGVAMAGAAISIAVR